MGTSPLDASGAFRTLRDTGTSPGSLPRVLLIDDVSWNTALSLLAALTGSLSLGLLAVVQSRIAAFRDGSFSLLVALALTVCLALGAGAGLGRALAKKQLARRGGPTSPPQHPSMLASVAVEAARGEPPRWELLRLAAALLLCSALPLSSILWVLLGGGIIDDVDSAAMLSSSAASALLLSTALGAQLRVFRPTALLTLAGLLLGGFAAGVGLGGRTTTMVLGLNEFSTLTVVLTSGASILCVSSARLQRWYSPMLVGIMILLTGKGATFVYGTLDDAYEKLTPVEGRAPDERFARVFENRSGVLTVTSAGWIHQNGRVQGIFNTSPIPSVDTNRSVRAYVIPAIFKRNVNVLMLGLGSGSFAQILVHHPEIERVVVLEENAAYLEAIENSGQIASLRENDKFSWIGGDPLRTFAEQGKFDVIIVDRLPYRTSENELLTEKRLRALGRRLSDGGALYVNTLGNPETERALLDSFSHLLRYQDMVFASNTRLRVDGYKWMRDLMEWTIDGRPVLSTAHDPTEVARQIVKNRDFRGSFAWEREDAIRARTENLSSPAPSEFHPMRWRLDKLP